MNQSLPPEVTLGGYMARHDRAAAFEGANGRAYSVAIYVEEAPDEKGRFGASLLFVRWNDGGTEPDGHVETATVAWGPTPEEAEARLKAWSLYDVRAALDQAILDRPEGW